MKRLIIVYNPRSSRFADVKQKVLSPAQKLKGYMIGKYEVKPTHLEDNISKLSRLIQDNDLVLSAGGDATGIIASNAILKSGRRATLAVLPYGNFNDLARTLNLSCFDDIFSEHTKPVKYYPLEIKVDDKFFRWATCYVTIGMTAEAVKLYDSPTMRKKLKTNFGRKIISYTELLRWYFTNRHHKQFIPDFRFNGESQPADSSDYAAVNGRYMARVMRGRTDYLDPKVFRSVVGRLTHFWRLFSLMFTSIVDRVPGTDTTKDILKFDQPSSVELQTEGESKVFDHARTIEVKKSSKAFYALQKGN